jgi:hypothetical protein
MARNTLSKGGPAGGPGSKAVARVQTFFTGKPSEKISPGGVSQYGGAVGSHVTDRGDTGYRGDPVRVGTKPSVALGNQTALEAAQGAGAGRAVSRTGTQGQHGPVAGQPKPQGADILHQYGAESPTAIERMKR